MSRREVFRCAVYTAIALAAVLMMLAIPRVVMARMNSGLNQVHTEATQQDFSWVNDSAR